MTRISALFLSAVSVVAVMAGAVMADERRDDGRGEHGSRGFPAERGGFPSERGGYHEQRGDFGGYRASPRAYAPPPAFAAPRTYVQPAARPPNSLGADWREQQEEARYGVRQRQMAPLDNVIQGIGRRSAGRPLDAGIEYKDGRAVYRVRWLMNNGRRVDYLVDAASGAIIGQH